MDYGLIIDLETTGIDAERDRIIELGLIEFAVMDGHLPIITGTYGAVEDPGLPLSEEIKKITGLDDPFLQGRQIDWTQVRQYMERASIVIAHNAAFDSGFLKRRPELAGVEMHWACSIRHIDWEAKGFKTSALNYLAADHGFVNAFAHRAVFDCATTFRLVAPHLSELVARSWQKDVRIWATGAPYEAKDKLKNRRYRWDGERRAWFKDMAEDKLEDERRFLASEIYSGRDLHQEEPLPPIS